MKRVVVLIGSARHGGTYKAVSQFLANLNEYEPLESEIVFLHKYNLKYCLGCKLCFEKGEAFCPLRDDRDKILEKIDSADGVVFATPNYSFQVSGITKSFLDRLGFVFHRPRFFGKVYTNIVFQGIYGGRKIVRYLDFVGNGMGFRIVRGSCLTALEPISPHDQKKNDKILMSHSRLFIKELHEQTAPSPTLFKLMMFRIARTSMRLLLTPADADYAYYQKKGWFESDYYYPTKLRAGKKMVGCFFDLMTKNLSKQKK